MKKRRFRWARQEKILRGLLALLLLFAQHSYGAQVVAGIVDPGRFAAAHITRVVKDVKLILPNAAPRPAALRSPLPDGIAVRVGPASRSELILANQTIARLGANTLVSLSEAARTLNLGQGAMLFQIPEGGEETKIKTAAITIASKGATGVIERHAQSYVKLMLLEGEARVYLENQLGESLVIDAGQILITKPDVTALPEPAHFDIAREMKTCLLIREFEPLPSYGLIQSEQRKQAELIRKGRYIPSNLVIFGRGTLVSLIDPAALNKCEQKSAPKPPP